MVMMAWLLMMLAQHGGVVTFAIGVDVAVHVVVVVEEETL